MATKMKIKKNDRVIVIAGKDKGKTGTVVRVMPEEQRLVVSGVNQITRHKRPTAQAAGGIEKREAAIHVSNVAHLDPKANKPTRVGFKVLSDGRKVRVAKRSGEQIDN
ncbi:MAG: 50S ribosomal protein L24 [Alphaproteobacteria bacterium]|nr:50S ribosomal protein L24 [Alphaproteobacteria bacterium]